MRVLSILLGLIVLPALLTLLSSAAAPQEPDGLLADLYQSTYVTVTELDAVIPHGEFTINEGVVAMFPGMERRTAGLFMGDMTVTTDKLPQGDGVLDLLHDLNGGKRVISFDVDAAYISAAVTSECRMLPSGYIKAMRKWENLSADEQESFRSIYLQAYSDAWLAEQAGMEAGSHWAGGTSGMGAPALSLRDPVGQEVFIAAWGSQPFSGDAAAGSADEWRYDYRVSADGNEVSISDYYRGITLFQSPWVAEEGEEDPSLHFREIDYFYCFNPPQGEGEARQPGRMRLNVTAHLWAEQQTQRLSLVSAPWIEFSSAALTIGENGLEQQPVPLKISRGGSGVSDWMLTLEGATLEPAVEYTLQLSGEYDVPDTFAATGYAGVYRFDSSALWPGDREACGIQIVASLPGGEWNCIASNGAYLSGHPIEEFEQPAEFAGVPHPDAVIARWEDSTRNQMIVATQFPSRELATSWGTLQVFAPQELIGSIEQVDYIDAVGDMIEYYGSLWGQRSAELQPLYIIPGESGVQAFEDAGLVFILGGDRPGIPLVAHEVAHLWWGNDVATPRWFYEGMANYSASKYVEHYYGEGGPGAGQGDPYSYRRYIINFGLGYELPLSLERRDELDDSAAIYHNSAGFLLTCDARLPYGFDGPLSRIYAAANGAPPISHEELRGLLADQSELLGPLWDKYVEQGVIEHSETDDETYREFVFTPGREKYVQMLRWLSPARRKAAIGDIEGALYCANRALEFRSEPKDYLYIAELTLKAGRADEAMERATALLEREDLDAPTRVKLYYLQSKVFRQRGDSVNEKAALEAVVQDGPAAGLLTEVQAAQERLKEL